MTEEKQKPKIEEKKIIVVEQIPTQEVRNLKDDDGKEVSIINIPEALTEIISRLEKLERGLL